MALEVQVLSGKIGSNPGGRCLIEDPHRRLQYPVYIKHVLGSKIHGDHDFLIPNHQPLYEAITFAMARQVGLHTPDYFVLLNTANDVHFRSIEGEKMDIRPDRHFYFVSELMLHPEHEDLDLAGKIIELENVHLDLLQISDIVGIKQNYVVTDGKVFYIDLGCSFVDAHNGMIELKTHHHHPLVGKDLKNGLRNLAKYTLLCANSDCKIQMDGLATFPRNLELPTLNPKGRIRLDTIMSGAEIDEIVGRFAAGFTKRIRKHKDSPYLLKNQKR